MTAFLTLPQNGVVAGQSGHENDHNRVYSALLALWTAVQQSMYNVASPTFGTVDPTGVSDSTTAIQNAITAAQSAGGGVVCVPAGTYKCNGLTVTGNNVRIIGAGASATVLKKPTAGTLLSYQGTTSPSLGSTHVRYCSLENIGINGNSQTGPALQLYYVDNFYCRDVQINSNSDLAIDCVEFWDSRFFNLAVINCGGAANSATAPNMWIRNSSAASGFGASTGSSNQIHLIGCRFEGSLTGALWITQGTSNSANPNNFKILSCKFEADAIQGGPLIQTDNTTKNVVIDDVNIQLGGFAGGYSTAQAAISLGGGNHILSNVTIGDGVSATISNGVFLHAVGGSSITVTNVLGGYTTNPTVGHLNFDASATGTYFISNAPTSGGTQFAGSPPATLASLASVAVANPLLLNGGSSSVNSAPVLTPALANGTAAQLTDTTRDYMVYLTVGTAGTAFTVAIGPTSTPANTIVPSGTATSGQVVSFRLPAGWFVKWSATTATLAGQKAIGC